MVVADVIIDFLILKRDFGIGDVDDDDVYRMRRERENKQCRTSNRDVG